MKRCENAMGQHHLILGGARSGKSRFAEELALNQSQNPTYVATSKIWDEKHQARIIEHQMRRDSRWTTIEEPLALAETLARIDKIKKVILVDCLSLWVSNLMFDTQSDKTVLAKAETVCEQLSSMKSNIIFVSNEVGMGVHPETALGNRFRDLAGLVNQRFASTVNTVDLVIAGLPLSLKK